MSEKVELSSLEWFVRVKQTLTLIFHNIRNGIDITEKQKETLKALYPVYYNGSLSLQKDVKVTKQQVLEQGNLFMSEDKIKTPNGTKVDK